MRPSSRTRGARAPTKKLERAALCARVGGAGRPREAREGLAGRFCIIAPRLFPHGGARQRPNVSGRLLRLFPF